MFLRMKQGDGLLIAAVFVLVLFGLSAIYSVALSQPASDFLNVKKQASALLVGTVLFISASVFNYRLFRNYALVLYTIGNFLLLFVLFFGETIRGTTGWFSVWLVNFQPVELMKYILIVALASYFSRRARRLFGWRELAESGLILSVPVGLTLLQPDLGSVLLFCGTWGVFILFVGIPKRHLFLMLSGLALLVWVAWSFLFVAYQRDRILTFLQPSLDPLGRGYNVTQAVIAVGSGGWFGRGLGFGSQSQLKFLPESQTDFIFAVIAEELGLVGVLCVLGAFLFLFIRLLGLARRTQDEFATFLVIGCGAAFFLQVFVNVGMNMGLLPVTGIGLPLVSYGGSSLMLFLGMLGVVNGIARQTPISSGINT